MKSKRPVVLTDRDGTLIVDVPYLSRILDVAFLPGVVPSIRRLNDRGIPVLVVTNQSGVARGYFTEDFVRETHAYMNDLLTEEGAHIDAFFYCPHLGDAPVLDYRFECGCRKPRPGMLEEALERFSGDPGRSMMVGDSLRDVLAGKSLGCHNFLIQAQEEACDSVSGSPIEGARIVSSFEEAVDYYLRDFSG